MGVSDCRRVASRALVGLGAISAMMGAPWIARADGLLPPRPYHYLHPPTSLAKGNRRPASVTRSFRLVRGVLRQDITLFTGDGQAGLQIRRGGLQGPPRTTSLRITIRPVNAPAALPDHLGLDGNAYSFGATAEPGGGRVRVRHDFSVVLRWPLVPYAVYQYRPHRWGTLCGEGHWALTPGVVLCHDSALAIVAAVHHPSSVKP